MCNFTKILPQLEALTKSHWPAHAQVEVILGIPLGAEDHNGGLTR